MKLINNVKNSLVGVRWNIFAMFVPGLMLALVGVAVILAPRFVLAILGGILLVAGFMVSLLVYKLLRVKSQIERAMRQFEGRVVLQGMNIQPQTPTDIQVDTKKIMYH
jgi:hypothetical protein